MRFTYDGKQQWRTLLIDGRPLAPTAANIRHAERLVVEIKEKVRLGIFSMSEYFATEDGEVLTVKRQLDDWLDAQRIEASTKKGYSSAIKFWATPLGTKHIKALKYSDILKVIAAHPELTGKTLNNYVSVLREALELAVTDGTLKENPASNVKRLKHQKEPPDPFSADERDRIIASMAERYPGQVANFVEFWFWSGLRTSEIFGLSWRNVDMASGTVAIKEVVVRGEAKARTKTNVARKLKLNSHAMAALQRQRQHTQVAGEAVFHDPRYGAAWADERAFRRSYWEPTLKLLGIRYRRPYNMRHTYATTMLMAGLNPAFCAKQLGHSVQVFHTTYTRWIDGERDDIEMARLESTISPATAQKQIKHP